MTDRLVITNGCLWKAYSGENKSVFCLAKIQ